MGRSEHTSSTTMSRTQGQASSSNPSRMLSWVALWQATRRHARRATRSKEQAPTWRGWIKGSRSRSATEKWPRSPEGMPSTFWPRAASQGISPKESSFVQGFPKSSVLGVPGSVPGGSWVLHGFCEHTGAWTWAKVGGTARHNGAE